MAAKQGGAQGVPVASARTGASSPRHCECFRQAGRSQKGSPAKSGIEPRQPRAEHELERRPGAGGGQKGAGVPGLVLGRGKVGKRAAGAEIVAVRLLVGWASAAGFGSAAGHGVGSCCVRGIVRRAEGAGISFLPGFLRGAAASRARGRPRSHAPAFAGLGIGSGPGTAPQEGTVRFEGTTRDAILNGAHEAHLRRSRARDPSRAVRPSTRSPVPFAPVKERSKRTNGRTVPRPPLVGEGAGDRRAPVSLETRGTDGRLRVALPPWRPVGPAGRCPPLFAPEGNERAGTPRAAGCPLSREGGAGREPGRPDSSGQVSSSAATGSPPARPPVGRERMAGAPPVRPRPSRRGWGRTPDPAFPRRLADDAGARRATR